MYFILNLLTEWGMKKKYTKRGELSFMQNIACKTEHEECCEK